MGMGDFSRVFTLCSYSYREPAGFIKLFPFSVISL